MSKADAAPEDESAVVASMARQEVRCAVRFPLALPVVLTADNQEIIALTCNLSASGALFELDRKLQPGMEIRFSIRRPGAVLGTPDDVLVHCVGRVVRCSLSQNKFLAAATIDEYRFAEQ
jgi:hypothetical protein